MRVPMIPTHRRRGASLVALAATGALLAGCIVGQPTQPVEPPIEGVIKSNPGTLINEGGPVFALPGSIKLPGYFQGDMTALEVRAERLDGGTFPKVAPAPVGAGGAFTLEGPITSQLFFATTEFSHENHPHRLRALARAQGGDPLVLDGASTLMSAKIALAAQKRFLDDLDYTEATELTAQVRSAVGAELQAVPLDQPNEALSAALTESVKPYQTLSARLAAWESAIMPPEAPAPTPSPSPTPTPDPTPTPVPVK